jgi:hypothetical protein
MSKFSEFHFKTFDEKNGSVITGDVWSLEVRRSHVNVSIRVTDEGALVIENRDYRKTLALTSFNSSQVVICVG